VSPNADKLVIKQAYRKKAQILHPDKTAGDNEKSEAFIKLHHAYVNLSDPKIHKLYEQPRVGSGHWVEGKTSSQISGRGVGFGRFLSWMFVLIGCITIAVYAFDIYQNELITSFSGQPPTDRSGEPKLISKKQSNELLQTKAKEIVDSKMPHSSSDRAPIIESEALAVPESRIKVNGGKNTDAVIASSDKLISAVFPQQVQTKNDELVDQTDMGQPVKKTTIAKVKLPQKQNIQVALRVAASPIKTNTGTVNKTVRGPNVSKDILKMTKIKGVDFMQEQQRLLAFLKKYTRAYEQKDLNRFKTFFAQNALEQGMPFEAMLPTYQKTFNQVEALRYHINLQSFTIDDAAKKILVKGAYTASYRLPEKKWGNSSGAIRMELLDSYGDLIVSRLDYEKGIR
jgi:curved DNA-binding protein CbpA